MMDREKILSDFKAQFLASIGTVGSHKGMPLTEAVKVFEKDWGKSVLYYLHLLGHSTTNELFAELEKDCVKLKSGIVYPMVKATNSHVFDLIDRTRKKRRFSKSAVAMSKYRNARASFSASHHYFGGCGFTLFSKPIFPSNQKFCRSLPKCTSQRSALNSMPMPSPKAKNHTFDFSESMMMDKNPCFALFSEKKPPKMFACNESTVDKSQNFALFSECKPPKMFEERTHLKTSQNHPKSPCSITPVRWHRTVAVNRKVSLFAASTPASQNRWKPSQSCNSSFTSSQPSSKNVEKTLLTASYENTSLQVRELIALIHQSGGQMKLDELQKTYLRRHDEVLTGMKLSTILQVNNKSHFVAFNAYRPQLFECTLVANTLVVRLLKSCDLILNKMRACGELDLDSKKSASIVSSNSNAMSASSHLKPTTVTSNKPLNTSASSFFVYRTSCKNGGRYARGSGYSSDLASDAQTISSGDEDSAATAILRRYTPSLGSHACRSRDGTVVAERLVKASSFGCNRQKVGLPTMYDVRKCIAGMKQQYSAGFFKSAFVLKMFEENLVHVIMRMSLTKNETKMVYNQKRQFDICK